MNDNVRKKAAKSQLRQLPNIVKFVVERTYTVFYHKIELSLRMMFFAKELPRTVRKNFNATFLDAYCSETEIR